MSKANGEIIAKIFKWAWDAGLDVNLSSRNYELAARDYPLARVDSSMPVLRFSYGDMHMEITGRNWPDLVCRLEACYAEMEDLIYAARLVAAQFKTPGCSIDKLRKALKDIGIEGEGS